MRLQEFLSADRMIVPLTTTTLLGAAEALMEQLVASGSVGGVEKLRHRISEHRAEDTVVIPDRAFLLHYRTDAVMELRVALGTSRSDIVRDTGDGEQQRARVVLVLLAPPRAAARHLQVVRGFGRLLSRPESVERILGAESASALASLTLFGDYQLPEQLTVRDLMSDSPRTTTPDTPIRDAAREMIGAGLGALAVVDASGRLLGVLSERELVRHLLTTQVLADSMSVRHPSQAGAGAAPRTVREVMTRQVLCVAPEQPISEVASLMSNKDVERVPVVREGRLVGFLTRGDIVRKLIGP